MNTRRCLSNDRLHFALVFFSFLVVLLRLFFDNRSSWLLLKLIVGRVQLHLGHAARRLHLIVGKVVQVADVGRRHVILVVLVATAVAAATIHAVILKSGRGRVVGNVEREAAGNGRRRVVKDLDVGVDGAASTAVAAARRRATTASAASASCAVAAAWTGTAATIVAAAQPRAAREHLHVVDALGEGSFDAAAPPVRRSADHRASFVRARCCRCCRCRRRRLWSIVVVVVAARVSCLVVGAAAVLVLVDVLGGLFEDLVDLVGAEQTRLLVLADQLERIAEHVLTHHLRLEFAQRRRLVLQVLVVVAHLLDGHAVQVVLVGRLAATLAEVQPHLVHRLDQLAARYLRRISSHSPSTYH